MEKSGGQRQEAAMALMTNKSSRILNGSTTLEARKTLLMKNTHARVYIRATAVTAAREVEGASARVKVYKMSA
jgi:hypothetical protein